jgi:putative endonuclease
LQGARDMTQSRIALGKRGEDLACRELERRGYAILARRYRRRIGEIDIVCRDGKTIVFVEVKARDGREFGDGSEAVTWMKRRRIVALATEYLTRHHLSDHPCRFDVISIQMKAGEPMIELFQAAFDATGD